MGAVTHHPLFYFHDGSAIFQLDNILYKLHMSLLQPTSIVFRNMFTMPAGKDGSAPPEGTNDDNPIRLELPFTVMKFDHLLKWFYRFGTEFPPLEALTCILELGTFLEMDLARAFAVQALSAPNMSLSPALRLSLSLSFRISDWIEPAFRELLTTPAHRIPPDDWALLGSPVTHLLNSTQSEVRCLRLAIAFNPLKPLSHDVTCSKPVMGCQSHWEAAWWDGLARHYLHPDLPSSPSEILSKLETTAIVGVTTACRLRAVDVIKEQRVFEREHDIIENALKSLKKFEGTVFFN